MGSNNVTQLLTVLLTVSYFIKLVSCSIFGSSHERQDSSCSAESQNFKTFLPPNYNKLAIPTLQLNDTNKTEVQVQVGVSLMIFKIMEIDKKKEVQI